MTKYVSQKEIDAFVEALFELCNKHGVASLVLEMTDNVVDFDNFEVTFRESLNAGSGLGHPTRPKFTRAQEKWIDHIVHAWHLRYKSRLGNDFKDCLDHLKILIKGEKK